MSFGDLGVVCELCRMLHDEGHPLKPVRYNGKLLNVCEKCSARFCSACNAQGVEFLLDNLSTGQKLHVCDTCVNIYAYKGSNWIVEIESRNGAQGSALGI